MKYILPCTFSFILGVLLAFSLIEYQLNRKKEQFKQEVKTAVVDKYEAFKSKFKKDGSKEIVEKTD